MTSIHNSWPIYSTYTRTRHSICVHWLRYKIQQLLHLHLVSGVTCLGSYIKRKPKEKATSVWYVFGCSATIWSDNLKVIAQQTFSFHFETSWNQPETFTSLDFTFLLLTSTKQMTKYVSVTLLHAWLIAQLAELFYFYGKIRIVSTYSCIVHFK